MVKYDVLCVGSATIDHFLIIEPSFLRIKPGDKILVNRQETHSGGGGTNSAAALAKLGLKVKLLAKLGADAAAENILKELKNYRIKIVPTSRSRKTTDSSTVVFSQQDKDRIIYVYKGASAELAVSDVKASLFPVSWVYLASLTDNSLRAGFKIAQIVKLQKINLLFNPSIYLAQLGYGKLKPILNAARILVLNLEEAQALCNSRQAPLDLLIKLQQYGPKVVIITDGPRLMYAANGDQSYSLQPPAVKVVQTAGAGDAFTAGFLAGLIKNYSFKQALSLGQVNAISVIQDIGTKNKLLAEKESQRLIAKYKIKIMVKPR